MELFVLLAIAIVLMLVCYQWQYGTNFSSFHLLAYGGTSTTATLTPDLTAFIDAEFSTRNNHFLFSEQYSLLFVAGYAATGTEANLLSPTLNAITKFNVWPLNDSTVSASPPRIDFWTHQPVMLPQNEEIQAQVVTTAADTITMFLGIAPTGNWNRKIPKGIPPVPVFEMRFTCSPTFATGKWSTLVTPAFEQSLRGGTYAVVGLEMQGTALLAARVVFPQAFIYNKRRLRPGFIASQAIGDVTAVVGDIGPFFLGPYGIFTTAELPNIEATGLGSSSVACQGIMRLVRLSEAINVDYGALTY